MATLKVENLRLLVNFIAHFTFKCVKSIAAGYDVFRELPKFPIA
jgi:hypothetical protein